MSDQITLTGLVATSPRHITTSEGVSITSFRLASNQRRFDRTANAWVDGDTNWYTITAFADLAKNVAQSIEKGQHIVVNGDVRIRDWEAGEKSGTTIEITAGSIGHDLNYGTAAFARRAISVDRSTERATERAEAHEAIAAAAEPARGI